MPEMRALMFDVFGTLVDWRTGVLDAARSAGERSGVAADWEAVTDDWRRAYQPALDAVRREPAWRDLDDVQRGTLEQVLAARGVDLPAADRARLVAAWRRLPPWPDTRDGLDRLRAGFRTATLSNGHVALLVDLFRFAELRVDALLSAQLAGSYKPDPASYARAVELLGCAPAEVGMVATHAGDLVAAAAVGLRPLFVRRPTEWGPAGGDEPPSGLADLLVADSLTALADALGC